MFCMALEYIDQFDEVLGWMREDSRVEPAGIFATSFDELGLLLKHSQHTLGYPDAEEFIDHEKEHLAAANVIGVEEFVFALVVHPWTPRAPWGTDVGVQGAVLPRYNKSHTSLQIASICGHPSNPSDQDISSVSALGYTIKQLAEAAKRTNDINGRVVIPVPLSSI